MLFCFLLNISMLEYGPVCLCLCMHVSVGIPVCICIYACLCIRMCIYVSLSIFVYLCRCVCMSHTCACLCAQSVLTSLHHDFSGCPWPFLHTFLPATQTLYSSKNHVILPAYIIFFHGLTFAQTPSFSPSSCSLFTTLISFTSAFIKRGVFFLLLRKDPALMSSLSSPWINTQESSTALLSNWVIAALSYSLTYLAKFSIIKTTVVCCDDAPTVCLSLSRCIHCGIL